ncbi:unnamed protein product [Meganyctiphanes norvegica]|uniref:C-type lectin domain-containing protein n=1 Tax=Meganyctiphanes norvegica TaxID=48144 RepID=A0AAV2S7T5_MEGNR
MAWLCRGIILLLGLLSQTDYVQACDDDCKDDLIQKFQNLLESQLDSKMEQIIMKIESKFETLLEDRLENFLDTKLNLKMDQISNSLTTNQNAISSDLQSVKEQIESYANSLDELNTSNVFMTSQLIEHLAQDKETDNAPSSQNISNVNDSLNELKTLAKESNVILTELMEDCKGPSNTTTQQLNDILESTEEMDLNEMKADNVTGSSLITLSNEVERCPSGFIKMSSQCFKMFRDSKRSWSDAKTKCEQEGYILAQPDDSVAVNLRTKVLETHGDYMSAWLGAQGDGSKLVYAHGGLALDNASPLWYPGHPGSNVGAENCLLLLGGSDFRDHPARPYVSNPCAWSQYTLCEVK